MLILIGLLLGLLLGLFSNILLPTSLVAYLAIFTLVGIEALTGSWIAFRQGDFVPGRFLIELGANLLVAALMTALGNQLKYDFSMIVSFIFAYRIFRNISHLSRRLYLAIKAKKEGRHLEAGAGEEDTIPEPLP